MMTKPIVGKMLTYLMDSLDNITSAPFVYLTKSSDPISLHRAVEYITANEMTNHIYVVHFVDDRKAIRMRKVFNTKAQEQVAAGRIREADALKFSDNLLLDMFQDDNNNLFRSAFRTDAEGNDDGDDGDGGDGTNSNTFSLRLAINTLPPQVQKLVHTVSILDAFYT